VYTYPPPRKDTGLRSCGAVVVLFNGECLNQCVIFFRCAVYIVKYFRPWTMLYIYFGKRYLKVICHVV